MGKLWNVTPFITLNGSESDPGTLKDGIGIKLNYYPDGNLEISCHFDDGVPNGSWKYYYENGTITEEGQFEKGQKTGYWIMYFKNGKKESSGTYTRDNKSGAWIYYSKSGNILRKVDEETGKML